jgi:dihydroorotate dehydrogenase (NAD+) catalytic subunit
VIGIGGISTWEDALEYIMAGATAVGIGTAWFVDTGVFTAVRDGLADYCRDQRTTIAEARAIVHRS